VIEGVGDRAFMNNKIFENSALNLRILSKENGLISIFFLIFCCSSSI
jgi:hypothetical protein